MTHYLDFEKPIAELEGEIEELRHVSGSSEMNIAEEVSRLQQKIERQLRQTYAKLSAWQKVQVARHPERPHALDYIAKLVDDWTPLAGDRLFGDDQAIVSGMGRIDGRSCVILGQERGHDTESRVRHNFGMAKPEGYRKAQRLMKLADRFHLPVVALVDTAGAYPGIDAEARGQAEAIARALQVCFEIRVPYVAVVIGEGGSGGAIAIAAANRVLMLEHAVYSVISPEGCASILWRTRDKAADAAEALKLTAQDLHKLAVIDEIIPEPLGAAHREPAETILRVGSAIARNLRDLASLDGGALRSRRREKFLEMGRKGLS
jgi:acetyl-CoA carboxylase carboxyl transferase subunit alpha